MTPWDFLDRDGTSFVVCVIVVVWTVAYAVRYVRRVEE